MSTRRRHPKKREAPAGAAGHRARTGRRQIGARGTEGAGIAAQGRTRAVAAAAVILAIVVVAMAAHAAFHSSSNEIPYRKAVAKISAEYGLDPYLVSAVMQVESGGDPDAVSDAGAMGLMQVTDIAAQEAVNQGYVTGRAATLRNLRDPKTNIRYGCAVLALLSDRYDGDERVVLAAYNGGPANADRWLQAAGGSDITEVIDLPETLSYVERVEEAKAQLQAGYPDAFS